MDKFKIYLTCEEWIDGGKPEILRAGKGRESDLDGGCSHSGGSGTSRKFRYRGRGVR